MRGAAFYDSSGFNAGYNQCWFDRNNLGVPQCRSRSTSPNLPLTFFNSNSRSRSTIWKRPPKRARMRSRAPGGCCTNRTKPFRPPNSSGVGRLDREAELAQDLLPLLYGQLFARRTQNQAGCAMAHLHQVWRRACGTLLSDFAQDPTHTFLHHVVCILDQAIAKLEDFLKADGATCAMHHGDSRPASLPPIGRLGPPKNNSRAAWLRRNQRSNQVEAQSIAGIPGSDMG